jgi:hypothetical protein
MSKTLHAQRGMMAPSEGGIPSFCGRKFPDQSGFWNIITEERRGKRCKTCVAAIKRNAKRWR